MRAVGRGGPWDLLSSPACPSWFGSWPTQWRPDARDELEWKNVSVDGRRAAYAVGGEGVPVVLLHGWALGHHAYKRSLKRLIRRGCRVYAPAMPGFSGSADLPGDQRTLEGYGAWVRRFMDAVAIEEPAMLIGHSFGGGVAIKLAHDFPDHVRYLVLLNSVGSPGTTAPRRAPWQWWWSFTREFGSPERGAQLMWATSEDFVPNLLRNPRAIWEVGHLARRADLTAELQALAERDVPVLVLWGDDDQVIPLTSFDALCSAIGVEGTVLSGNHCWMLADVDAFDEVMANVVEVARPRPPAPAGTDGHGGTAGAPPGGTGGATELRRLLDATSMPADLVSSLVDGAPALWLLSDPPSVLAADLALCSPPLRDGEVRAVAHPVPGGARLTVVAADRPGLLADTTAALAAEGLSVSSAAAATWPGQGLALHTLSLDTGADLPPGRWDELGRRLRTIGTADPPEVPFEPTGHALVTSTPQQGGQSLVRVTAPDQVGLLWAVCRWLGDHEVNIEAARVSGTGGTARDSFVVAGRFDPAALQVRLSRARPPSWQRLTTDLVASFRAFAEAATPTPPSNGNGQGERRSARS